MHEVGTEAAVRDLRFLSLGSLEVLRDDEPVALGHPLQRTLLAALLVDAPRSVPVATLLERLWPGDPPATASKSVQKYVSNLRKLLGHDRIRSSGGYALAAGEDETDAHTFEAALAAIGRTEAPGARLQLADDALALWRGDPFVDLPEPLFLEPVRRRLSEIRLSLIEERLKAMLELGEADPVIAETETLVTDHPFRERIWQLRMSALAAAGRQAEALDAFRRLREALGEELGIDPSPASRDLELRILQQDPSVAPTEPARGNLPAAVIRIIGRERELDELSQVLDGVRLLTLTGPGGVGKTTLAVELARRRAAEIRGGAWLIRLDEVDDPSRVASRTAEILGVHQHPHRDLTDVVAEHLTDRRALLVLDNCEHVLDAATALVAALLHAAPGLTVIATSRERLGVPGEAVAPVEPLPVPPRGAPVDSLHSFPSVQLLVERAREAGARIHDGSRAATGLADICRRLDGIPLALELAAARLRAFSPADLSARLDDLFDLLVNVNRVAPSRHQTLEAAIDWSFRLLPGSEQGLLLRLAVFRGPFTVETAERVCGSADVETAAALGSLVDRSLVSIVPQPDGERRYRLLEPVRRFAEQRLADDLRPLEERHAHHFASLVQAEAGDAAERVVRVGADYEDVRAALRFLLRDGDPVDGLRLAIALQPYWKDAGAMVEGRSWIGRALETAGAGPADLRVLGWLAASELEQPWDVDRSIEQAARALTLAEELGDRHLTASAANALGRLHAVRMEPDLAIPLLERACTVFEAERDGWSCASCFESLGVAHRGAPDRGLSYYRKAIEIYRDGRADAELAHALFSAAYRALTPAGGFDEARAMLTESLSISLRIGSRTTAAHAVSGLGQLARLAGELDEALGVLSFALGEFRVIGDRRCVARMQTALAMVAAGTGALDEAWSLVREALPLAVDVDDGPSEDVLDAIDAVAIAAWGRGRPEAATRWLGTSDAHRGRLGLFRSPPDQAAVEAALASLRDALGPQQVDELRGRGADLTVHTVVAELGALGPSEP